MTAIFPVFIISVWLIHSTCFQAPDQRLAVGFTLSQLPPKHKQYESNSSANNSPKITFLYKQATETEKVFKSSAIFLGIFFSQFYCSTVTLYRCSS